MSVVTVTLEVPDTPKSLNVLGTRGSHWAVNRAKKQWQSTLEGLLMASGLPRRLVSAEASAVLRFPTRHRRDIDNHSFILAKSLGDAMASAWIPDDAPAYWRFWGVEFDPDPGPARTLITVIGRDGGIERTAGARCAPTGNGDGSSAASRPLSTTGQGMA